MLASLLRPASWDWGHSVGRWFWICNERACWSASSPGYLNLILQRGPVFTQAWGAQGGMVWPRPHGPEFAGSQVMLYKHSSFPG